jgi:hypothetical protein
MVPIKKTERANFLDTEQYYRPIDAEESLVQLSDLPEVDITQDEWSAVFKHAPFPKSKVAEVKRRIHEALQRYVKNLEFHASRALYSKQRHEMIGYLTKVGLRLEEFKLFVADQPEVGVVFDHKPDRIYNVAADCSVLCNAIGLLNETLETMNFLSPKVLNTGPNNRGTVLLVRALDDIIRRHSGQQGLRRSLKSREFVLKKSESELGTSKPFNDVQFVLTVVEIGRKRVASRAKMKLDSLSKVEEQFIMSMIRKLNEKKRSVIARGL